jgi:hypothetical protein
VKRHRVFGQSYAWGEKPEQKPSEIKVNRPSLFGGRVTKEIVTEWGIGIAFHTQDRRIQGKPVGYDAGSPVRNLAADLLLSGTGALVVPDKPRVIELGHHWLNQLPAGIGDGPCVESVLVKHVWQLGLYPIDVELREAHEADEDNRKQERDVADQADPMLRSLEQSYRAAAVSDLRKDNKTLTIRRINRRYRELVKGAGPLVQALLA